MDSFDVLTFHFNVQLVPPSDGGLIADFISPTGFSPLHRTFYLFTSALWHQFTDQSLHWCAARISFLIDNVQDCSGSLTKLSYLQAFAFGIAFLWRHF